jgi:predicted TIM-barrel fold metal-dependent hydrolase
MPSPRDPIPDSFGGRKLAPQRLSIMLYLPRAERVLARRDFLVTSLLLAAAGPGGAAEPVSAADPIIDIHQHTDYTGRTHRQLLNHQRALGITTTVLLPAGSKFGLDCDCGGNQSVADFAREHAREFVFFANEVPDLPHATTEIARFLKQGAIGIGEQKFRVACDSKPIEALAELAGEHGVPILLHFQHNVYNTGLENFHRVLKKFPRVNFIGHAQTWWGSVDQKHDPKQLYPLSKVVPGGITDRLLTEFPNMFGDLSAGSGLNFLLRDADHARAFLERHQNQLLFGTDCNDPFGRGPGCQGAQTLAALRRLVSGREAERKILHGNARKLLKL